MAQCVHLLQEVDLTLNVATSLFFRPSRIFGFLPHSRDLDSSVRTCLNDQSIVTGSALGSSVRNCVPHPTLPPF